MGTRRFTKPAENVEELLRDGFRLMSRRLRVQFEHELAANQHNMESGLPLEDFFREEFGSLFEAPYGVDSGKIVDRNRETCGDCDFVIFDPRLAPLLKRPAAAGSRRKLFAFETTYGIIEVKQTLTLGATENGRLKDSPKGSLWDACTKVFAYKQLQRTAPEAFVRGINHPLGLIFFYNCDLDLTTEAARDALLLEFSVINREVGPEALVNGVYVLDQFGVNWAFAREPGSRTFLTLQHVVESPTKSIWVSFEDSKEDTLYRMFTQLWSTLARTQLGPPDLLEQYGGRKHIHAGKLRCRPFTAAAGAESALIRADASSASTGPAPGGVEYIGVQIQPLGDASGVYASLPGSTQAIVVSPCADVEAAVEQPMKPHVLETSVDACLSSDRKDVPPHDM